MNKIIKKKFVKWLRANKDKQIKCRMRDKKGFCATGGLCDVFDNKVWIYNEEEKLYYYDGWSSLPPPEILKAAEITEAQILHLQDMNDQGKTFDEIADYVESNL